MLAGVLAVLAVGLAAAGGAPPPQPGGLPDELVARALAASAGWCDIAREPHLDVPTFVARYKGRAPVITRRAPAQRAAIAAALARPALAQAYGGLPVILASSNSFSYAKRASTLGEYLADFLAPQAPGVPANATWYLFGDTQPTPEWAPLVGAYAPLPLDAAGDEGIVAWGVSGRWHGVQFHTHGAAFAEAVHGRKRWFLAPPAERPRFDPDESMLTWALARAGVGEGSGPGAGAGAGVAAAAVHPVQGATWSGNASAAGGAGGAGDAILECTCEEGELIYVPPMWWHATLNLDDYNAFVSVFTLEPFSVKAAQHAAPG